jgi:hypothetical protein
MEPADKQRDDIECGHENGEKRVAAMEPADERRDDK